MGDALDTIDYLARSDHRVEVLEAIRTAPRTRGEVRELVDASRVTVGRIMTDLEERGWTERDGRTYTATTRGRYVVSEFTRLVDNLETFEALPPVVEWLPDDVPLFDLRRLDDATIVTASERDLIAPMRRALALMEGADRLRAVANGASREFVEATRAAVAAGASHTLVLPTETIEAVRRDPELRAGVRAGLDGGLELLETDAELPILQIADDTVALCSGDHRGMVETDDAAVYDWADGYVTSLIASARPVPPESFGDPGVAEDVASVELSE